MYAYARCVYLMVLREQKKVLNLLELELQGIESLCVGAENRTGAPERTASAFNR